MSSAKITISRHLAVAEKLQRLRRARLAKECTRLDRAAEQAAAEEAFLSEAEWPEY